MPNPVEPDQELTELEERTRDLLLALPLFDAFTSDELDTLAQHMQSTEIMRGQHLFVEGEQGEFMCFVVRGLLDVLKKTTIGESRIITRLGKGQTIGEMSVFDTSTRSATVVARQPSVVILLAKQGFDLLSEQHPALALALTKRIMQLLSLNMRLTTSKLADQLSD